MFLSRLIFLSLSTIKNQTLCQPPRTKKTQRQSRKILTLRPIRQPQTETNQNIRLPQEANLLQVPTDRTSPTAKTKTATEPRLPHAVAVMVRLQAAILHVPRAILQVRVVVLHALAVILRVPAVRGRSRMAMAGAHIHSHRTIPRAEAVRAAGSRARETVVLKIINHRAGSRDRTGISLDLTRDGTNLVLTRDGINPDQTRAEASQDHIRDGISQDQTRAEASQDLIRAGI